MTSVRPGDPRAPLRPAIHVSPSTGWLNDPNGLTFHRGRWHAFYQHDPDSDAWRTMHWGHATSRDLLRWTDEPIALVPDRLGMIYSGSIVVDDDDTAGFGAGAMVAVFTQHDHDGVERQCLASSHDDGGTWQLFAGNPVLESDAPDFRDPKVTRLVVDGQPTWVMALAVGDRVEFYRSPDLRRWELTGSYTAEVGTAGAWECPDLVRLRSPAGTWTSLLMFGAVGVGPAGHSGVLGVLGEFDGHTFHAHGPPVRLDHGPDFYAAQSFSGLAEGDAVVMAWMNSWRYSNTHPSAGRRGVLSLPRRLGVQRGAEGADVVTAHPAVDLRARGTPVEATVVPSAPGRAVHVRGEGALELTLAADGSDIASVRIADGHLALRRHEPVVEGYAETYVVPVTSSAGHEIVVDHGTVEVYAGDGTATMSALVFPGPEWTIGVDGDATVALI